MLTLTTTLIFSYGSEHGKWRKVTKTGAQASDIQDLRSQDSGKEISIKRQAKFNPSTVVIKPYYHQHNKTHTDQIWKLYTAGAMNKHNDDRAHDRGTNGGSSRSSSHISLASQRGPPAGEGGGGGEGRKGKRHKKENRVCLCAGAFSYRWSEWWWRSPQASTCTV